MKLFRTILIDDSVGRASPRAGSSGASPHRAGFTMVELAISLAIIGIALVAIIGVLPIGMNVQRDNREGTIINQDATIFLNAISQGAHGLDDLTNYVYAVTNYQTRYVGGVIQPPNNLTVLGYNYFGSSTTPSLPLNNGTNIIGILSTPQLMDTGGNPANNLFSGGFSNHVIAYVRSMSGSAGEKPPQDNQIIQADAFGYRLLCVNAAVAVDTNIFRLPANQQPAYTTQIAASLHELRLTFFWPTLPNGGVGSGRQSYRTLVAGRINQDANNNGLYFFQSQSFANAFTNAP